MDLRGPVNALHCGINLFIIRTLASAYVCVVLAIRAALSAWLAVHGRRVPCSHLRQQHAANVNSVLLHMHGENGRFYIASVLDSFTLV